MKTRRLGCFLLLAALFLPGGPPRVFAETDDRAESLPAKTALDEYVAAPDDSYTWRVIKEESAHGQTSVVIDMISQTWRAEADVDRPVWQHWLTLTLPEKPRSNIGLLWIGGGSNGKDPPAAASERMQQVAKATGTVVAELSMVPNQPLVFHGDGQRRTEDDLIGYTWDQFLQNQDPNWLARNPMVKSAVRAMDTVSAYTSLGDGETVPVEKFVVAGGSKRGWTTWLTGAVDERVVGIIPIVIDVLNLRANMDHHFAVYGFFAPAVGDYVQHRIPPRRDHPAMPKLIELVDPYKYRHRLAMPKFIVNASGDQFFPPDSSQHYFADLPGEKHLRYVPNANHSLDGSDALESIIAYYSLILAGQQAPQFSWTHGEGGQLQVKTGDRPQEVRLWQATNREARDFRLETLGPRYESQVLEDRGDGTYLARVRAPQKGWTAYFAELTYDVGGKLPLKLTTDIRVVPCDRPFEDKDPTLPATITVQCTAPSAEAAERIVQSLRSQKLPEIDGEIRLFTSSPDLNVNWTPTGRIEESAKAVVDWLSEQGCKDFQYRLESGIPELFSE